MPAGDDVANTGGAQPPVDPVAPDAPDARNCAGSTSRGGSFSGVCEGNCTYATCPAPAPGAAPDARANSPSAASNTCTRSLPVSATMSVFPAVS